MPPPASRHPCASAFLTKTGRITSPWKTRVEFAENQRFTVAVVVRLGLEKFVYIDAHRDARFSLPAGAIFVPEGTKGPEYSPLRERVTLGPGQIALRFNLERWVDLRQEGWYPGDYPPP